MHPSRQASGAAGAQLVPWSCALGSTHEAGPKRADYGTDVARIRAGTSLVRVIHAIRVLANEVLLVLRPPSSLGWGCFAFKRCFKRLADGPIFSADSPSVCHFCSTTGAFTNERPGHPRSMIGTDTVQSSWGVGAPRPSSSVVGPCPASSIVGHRRLSAVGPKLLLPAQARRTPMRCRRPRRYRCSRRWAESEPRVAWCAGRCSRLYMCG